MNLSVIFVVAPARALREAGPGCEAERAGMKASGARGRYPGAGSARSCCHAVACLNHGMRLLPRVDDLTAERLVPAFHLGRQRSLRGQGTSAQCREPLAGRNELAPSATNASP